MCLLGPLNGEQVDGIFFLRSLLSSYTDEENLAKITGSIHQKVEEMNPTGLRSPRFKLETYNVKKGEFMMVNIAIAGVKPLPVKLVLQGNHLVLP